MTYYRAIPRTDSARTQEALPLAGGWCWFDTVECLDRENPTKLIGAKELPNDIREKLTTPRARMANLDFKRPILMGILNVTPDSFSDGGEHFNVNDALHRAIAMIEEGATLIDVGGESTRPGATEVSIEEEVRRTEPIIQAIRTKTKTPISIDTRKQPVARAAYNAGANFVNDVAGFTFDKDLAPFCAETDVPVCVMHAQGTPDVMQNDPHYRNVLFDVYDFLSKRIDSLVSVGVSRNQIVVDPGIGFGKTLEHNLLLLQNLSLFHTLGCPILLGASRKRFIGTIGGSENARHRAPGSIAVALAGLAQGVQVLRVHDVQETAEAMKLWQAAVFGAASH